MLRGNPLTRKTLAGAMIFCAYDALNRLTTKTPPLGPIVSYSYDRASRLTGVSDTSAAITPISSLTVTSLIADQVAINYRKADITARQTAMLDFAMKVSQTAQLVGDADIDTLKARGFDEEDVWDIAAIAAFFGLPNRLANATGMRPNREFYAMGRG